MRAVIDTSVLFEGLTNLGPCGDVVGAWEQRRFTPCVSTALALEYQEIFGTKFGLVKRRAALSALQALLCRADFVPISFSVRPMSPDSDDDFIIDCAFNGSAAIVTSNLKDFRGVHGGLRITVFSPADFLKALGGS